MRIQCPASQPIQSPPTTRCAGPGPSPRPQPRPRSSQRASAVIRSSQCISTASFLSLCRRLRLQHPRRQSEADTARARLPRHEPSGDLCCYEIAFKDTNPHQIRIEYTQTGRGGTGLSLEWAPRHELLQDEAVATAKKADVIVAFVGLTSRLEGEEMSVNAKGFSGGDRTDLRAARRAGGVDRDPCKDRQADGRRPAQRQRARRQLVAAKRPRHPGGLGIPVSPAARPSPRP